MRVLKNIIGAVLCFCTFGFTIAASQVEQEMQPFFIVLTLICAFAAYMLIRKTKKEKQKKADKRIKKRNKGKKAELNNPRIIRSYDDIELSFQFSMKHGVKSQRMSDLFLDLNSAAYAENDIDKKIELLQKSIDAFYEAKQWHYNYSKGAMYYFQDMWEYMHNSNNPQFSWVDSVEKELKYYSGVRDSVIPWITNQAEKGFLQTEIYEEFSEFSKSELRKIIDKLAQAEKVVKMKKGSSYFITKFQNETICQ